MLNRVKRTVKAVKRNVKLQKDAYVELAQYIKAVVKDSDNVDLPIDVGKTNFQGKEVYLVKYNTLFLGANKFPSACVSKSQGKYIIFVNNALLNAPKDIRDGVITHELGHISLGHVEDRIEATIGNFKRLLGSSATTQRELDADRMACEEGFSDGLCQFLEMIEDFMPDCPEIKERLKAIDKFRMKEDLEENPYVWSEKK